MPSQINEKCVNVIGTDGEVSASPKCPTLQQGRPSLYTTTAGHTKRHNLCADQIMQGAQKRKRCVDMNQKAIQCDEQDLLDKNNGRWLSCRKKWLSREYLAGKRNFPVTTNN